MSKEVTDNFVEALHKLEEDRDVEALVAIHTEDCEVGNVSIHKAFRGHDGLREFWTEYRKTFGEISPPSTTSSPPKTGRRSSGRRRVHPTAIRSPTTV